jgi:hypothetical protein
VTDTTMIRLIEFAAKDRECRAVPDRRFGMHDPIYGDYIRCMYESKRRACDASEADLRSLKALFARDPRLNLRFNLNSIGHQFQSECPSPGKPVFMDKLASWTESELRACSVQPHQPVLIAAAVKLKVTVPAGEDEGEYLSDWGPTCAGVKGIFFMEQHCRDVQSDRKKTYDVYTDTARPFTRPDEFGVEDYLCPMLYRYWTPR